MAAKFFYAFISNACSNLRETILVSWAAERAKKREEESEKGLLGRLKD